jgi:hypothetical protein
MKTPVRGRKYSAEGYKLSSERLLLGIFGVEAFSDRGTNETRIWRGDSVRAIGDRLKRRGFTVQKAVGRA